MNGSALKRRWRRLEWIFDLPDADQRRLVRTLGVVVGFRVGLWIIPFRHLKRIVDRPLDLPRREMPLPASQIGKEISRIARFIPEATCLTQALTALVLLRREGYSPVMHLGVARDEKGAFAAHAWVECEGKIIVGDLGPKMNYVRLDPRRVA